MPKLVAIHDVDDVDHWLKSPKRAEVFAGIVASHTLEIAKPQYTIRRHRHRSLLAGRR